MSGNQITEKERKKLALLREKVADEISARLRDDWTLLRWLRQNKGDVDLTAFRLRNHMDYRRYFDLDREDTDSFAVNPAVQKSFPFCWTGTYDKFGSPIAVRLAGKVDVYGSLKSISTSEYIKHEMMLSEKVMRLLRKEDAEKSRLVGMCVIIDLEGFHFDPYVLSLISTYFSRLEEHIVHHNFPLIDERLILLNAPRLLVSVYGLLKHVWPTIKIHIFDHNYKDKITDLIDPDQLPQRFGGAIDDGELSTPLADPEKLEARDFYSPANDPTDLFKIAVKPRHKLRLISMEVPADTTVSWFFKGDHDIAFGVYRVKEGVSDLRNEREGHSMEEVVVVPKYRSKTDVVPDSGQIVCKEKGLYALEFCNHHSRFTTKHILVHLEIKTPVGKKVEWHEMELLA